MNANGVAWPATGGDQLNGVEASVLVAFSVGFVEASDFYGRARLSRSSLLRNGRKCAACARRDALPATEVVALQQAAARVVTETERLRQMADGRPERVERQRERVERAHVLMERQAALVSARVDAAS